MAYTSINKPTDYFNTKLYTGNGSTQSITGVGFAPDMVWTKKRSATDFHAINDKVRGALKIVFPNTTDAEDTSSGCLTSFDSDGFSLGSNGGFNANTATFASWNWLASNTTASNTDGDITSTVSANTTSGFSIVSYTGTGANATVGHGLGQALDMLIVKNRDTAKNWRVWFKGFSGTERLQLDTTDAKTSTATSWNGTIPTSTVFSLGADTNTNNNTDEYVAYCFAEKKGYSKFGSYTGNGNADGTFVYTGFKPAWVMIKRATGGAGDWGIWDTKRNTFNVSNSIQRANTSDAEITLSPNNDIDILSNGFKVRSTTGLANLSGDDYIYMAFAESPFTTSTGVPTTAR